MNSRAKKRITQELEDPPTVFMAFLLTPCLVMALLGGFIGWFWVDDYFWAYNVTYEAVEVYEVHPSNAFDRKWYEEYGNEYSVGWIVDLTIYSNSSFYPRLELQDFLIQEHRKPPKRGDDLTIHWRIYHRSILSDEYELQRIFFANGAEWAPNEWPASS